MAAEYNSAYKYTNQNILCIFRKTQIAYVIFMFIGWHTVEYNLHI